HHYWIKKPSQAEFLACCNEFWWCLSNVGKGLVRQQLPYALRMYHETSHAELDKMIEWAIAITYDYQVNTGLWGKYFRDYLSEKDYNHYLKTYASGDVSHIWTAVWMAVEMFQEKARDVAHAFDYPYHQEEETAMICYLKGLKATTEFTKSQKSGRGMNDEYPQ
ncbi:MAG: aminoglycoside 6-adenylyltransferase, partial [Enterococcus aquimarinus]